VKNPKESGYLFLDPYNRAGVLFSRIPWKDANMENIDQGISSGWRRLATRISKEKGISNLGIREINTKHFFEGSRTIRMKYWRSL